MHQAYVARATEHGDAEREVLLVSWRTLLLRAGIPIVVIATWGAIDDQSWGTFVGLLVVFALMLGVLMPRALVIDNEGVRRRQLIPLIPTRKVRWAEVEGFKVGEIQGWPFVYYDFSGRRNVWQRVRRRVFNWNRGDGSFPPIFAPTHFQQALTQRELAGLLTHRLKHARRLEQRERHRHPAVAPGAQF